MPKREKTVMNRPISTKGTEVDPPGEDDIFSEKVDTEDLEMEARQDKFSKMKEDLALVNNEMEPSAEIKIPINETPIKCDIKKYAPSVIPTNFSIMCWNIDYNFKHFMKRSVAIVDLIIRENHDIILLQEVSTPFFNYMVPLLENKFVIVRQENKTFYYTVTLLKMDTVKYESHKIIYFKNTSQGRSILFTKVGVGGAKLDILNVHLESQIKKDKTQIRIAQLKKCMTIASSTPVDSNVVVGGSLNIRDRELRDIPLPKNTCDVWIQQGKVQDTEYTWDMTCNKNKPLEIHETATPKRFDRIYFRSSTPDTLMANYFGLTGKDKLKKVKNIFPSDHWAVVARFSLHKSVQYFPITPPTESPSSSVKDDFVKENWFDDD